MVLSDIEDCMLSILSRAGTFGFLDVPAKVETLALASFGCTLLGNLSEFPAPENFAIALLAMLASRTRSEAQLVGLIGFVLFTTCLKLV